MPCKKIMALLSISIVAIGWQCWSGNTSNFQSNKSTVLTHQSPEYNGLEFSKSLPRNYYSGQELRTGHITPIEGSNDVWYEVPEIGIKIRMSRAESDGIGYVYDIVTYNETDRLDRASFIWIPYIDVACTYPEEGSIIKHQGNAYDKAIRNKQSFIANRIDLENLRQFNGFYVAYLKPQYSGLSQEDLEQCTPADGEYPSISVKLGIPDIFQSVQPI